MRVVADASAADAAAAGLPAAYPAATRREYKKSKKLREQLGGDGEPGSAAAATLTVHAGSIMQTALAAARQAPETMGSHMAALMTDLPSQFADVAA